MPEWHGQEVKPAQEVTGFKHLPNSPVSTVPAGEQQQRMVWPLPVWARGIYHTRYPCPDNACAGLAQLQDTPSGQQRLAHLASPSSKGKSKGQKLTGQGKPIPSSEMERGEKGVLPKPLTSGI